jgi:serine/threonine protein phosphatase 1
MTRTYAIGDIHGHLDKLVEAHRRIAADRAATGDSEAPVVHLGDLVDRGPDSRGVVDFLLRGIAAAEPWVVLKGNHDRLMTMFLEADPRHDPSLRPEFSWLGDNLGGLRTLASYGVDVFGPRGGLHAAGRAAVPAAHIDFLTSLPLSFSRGACLFVHAGIRPGVPLERQSEADLLWIRREFHEDTRDHGVLVVHGHTPVEAILHHGNRVNLDSGVAFGGPLTVAVFEDREALVLEADGRRPVPRA